MNVAVVSKLGDKDFIETLSIGFINNNRWME
jgi:hypothetical protein